MKTCFKCKQTLPKAEFYRHPMMGDGHLGKCKECTKKDAREHRDKNIDQVLAYDRARARLPHRRALVIRINNSNPVKRAAHSAVSNAVRDGRLTKQPCEVCGATTKVEAHHPDYSKPLDVQWLCFRHHREVHGNRHFTKH